MSTQPAAPALRRRATPGVLGVIAGFYLLAGLMKLGLGAAGAQDALQAAPERAPATVAEAQDPLDLLESLRAREARVDRMEAAIAARGDALARAENELSRKLAELAEIEARLSETLALSDRAAERDLGTLTAVFENMKPRDAAALFEEMDVDFAAGFIARLRPETAAEVLAGLTPRSAYAISAVLAGRNMNVPTE